MNVETTKSGQCLGLRGERGGNDFVDPLMFGSRKQRGVVWFIRFIRFLSDFTRDTLKVLYIAEGQCVNLQNWLQYIPKSFLSI